MSICPARCLRLCCGLLSLCGFVLISVAIAEEPANDQAKKLLRQAVAAETAEEAIEIAGQAIAAAPEEPTAYWFRARALASLRKHDEAVKDFSQVIKLQPKNEEAYYWRGRSEFCAGQVTESIADFDHYGELNPAVKPQQWERGIALYYADRFKDGAAQFALYQTYHDNDVENATWRYLCMARDVGVEKAKAELLPIENDTRVPMMQIYALYRGEMTPAEVLQEAERVRGEGPQAAERLNQQLFYAHLYLGLYYEAAGKADLAKEHVLTAADKHPISHYMWDVARLHADRLSKVSKSQAPEK